MKLTSSKRKTLPFAFSLLTTSLLTSLVGLPIAPALANCNDRPASIEWFGPVMSEHFQQLQAQQLQTQPGPLSENASVLDRIEGRQIHLTPEFDRLTGAAKREVIDSLLAINFEDYLTAEELDAKVTSPGNAGIGTWPYDVVTADGRRVLEVYDGCTQRTLLTEKDRFDLYYTRYYDEVGQNTSQGHLRNAGTPSWRQVNFPIEATTELLVRTGFWNVIGYERSTGVEDLWWIAWVPEQGHFEVNVPENFDYDLLQRYWEVADRDYTYVVVREDGTQLGIKQF
ncbi:MAG: phosphoribosylaminoimidazolesuccinocarboxamide synthase [Cyanobacteria bacterium J06573_11]